MRAVRKYKDGGTDLTPFEKAFAEARAAGKETFMFEGKPFTTKTVEEEYYSKYAQPGSTDFTDQILNSPENVSEREAQRRLDEYMDFYAKSSGALTPMEGLNDPIFGALLGGRTIYKPTVSAVKTALGPKNNPLNRGYNLYPSKPGDFGVQPMNIYEEIARRFGRRFGTRTGPIKEGTGFGYGGKQGMGKVSDMLDDLVEQYLSSPVKPTP